MRILGKTALVGNGLLQRRRKLRKRSLNDGLYARVQIGIGIGF